MYNIPMKVIKIGAKWCPACLVMKPRWAEIEKENPWLQTEFYDYNDDSEKIKDFNVGKELPVFIYFDKEGNELERMIGEISKDKILETINKYKDF
jgi:thiol-disulfide isomerase/thioredoxin